MVMCVGRRRWGGESKQGVIDTGVVGRLHGGKEGEGEREESISVFWEY